MSEKYMLYKFRITYSTDVNQHYSFDGNDTTVSMVVEACTFREAEDLAGVQLEELLHGANPDKFEIVSVQNLTVTALEDERKSREAE